VQVGYFSQHTEDLPESSTVLEAFQRGVPLTQGQSRTILGRFLFGGEMADRKVAVLSGGERRRLLLARAVAGGANFLVLDEPTNHLDVESREALEEALDAYDGTVLFVSHDRALIDAIATHTLAIADRSVVMRLGDYNDYLAAAAQAAEPEPAKPAKPPAAPKPKPAPRQKPGRARRDRRVEELEAGIERLEAAIAGLERDLADPAVMSDRDLLAAAGEEHRAKQEELAWLMREWEEAATRAGS
jgi:ATP-binding cassette, subfamily F, member 3